MALSTQSPPSTPAKHSQLRLDTNPGAVAEFDGYLKTLIDFSLTFPLNFIPRGSQLLPLPSGSYYQRASIHIRPLSTSGALLKLVRSLQFSLSPLLGLTEVPWMFSTLLPFHQTPSEQDPSLVR
jgi:hypothetical protein